MRQQEIIPNLFRTEHQKMISVLIRSFGTEYLEVAEDIVSDTFLAASELWGLKGLPENPAGWLYVTAKNKALDYLRRNKLFREKIAPNVMADTKPGMEQFDLDLSEAYVKDSQLAMLFVVCNPCNKPVSQIALALNLLCGFGADEIAAAFLTDREVIYKRLQRAKQQLRLNRIAVEQPSAAQIKERLPEVLMTLYLVFNEGYYSEAANKLIREDLCKEAMRLMILLTESPLTALPATYALLALMCFHASRFDARLDNNGQVVLYQDQNRKLWEQPLIDKGRYYMHKAMEKKQEMTPEISRYHLEAGIAFWHSFPEEQQQKWPQILKLYDQLLLLEYSPMAALNRAYALSKVEGKTAAILEAEKIGLKNHHLYHSLLGELYEGVADEKAKFHLEKAREMAKSADARRILDGKLRILKQN